MDPSTPSAAAAPHEALDAADRPTSFGYHTIYASPEKYDDMVRWYKTLFGAAARPAAEGLSPHEALDPARDFILIVKRPGLPSSSVPFKPGFLHTAWFYNSLAELMYVYRHARENGIPATEVMTTPVLMQIYFIDPEGNCVELSVDAHDTSEVTQEAMRKAANIRAPGKDARNNNWYYDPDVVLKMLDAGVPDHEIFHQPTYHELAGSGRF